MKLTNIWREWRYEPAKAVNDRLNMLVLCNDRLIAENKRLNTAFAEAVDDAELWKQSEHVCSIQHDLRQKELTAETRAHKRTNRRADDLQCELAEMVDRLEQICAVRSLTEAKAIAGRPVG
jgi:hypothetical protein